MQLTNGVDNSFASLSRPVPCFSIQCPEMGVFFLLTCWGSLRVCVARGTHLRVCAPETHDSVFTHVLLPFAFPPNMMFWDGSIWLHADLFKYWFSWWFGSVSWFSSAHDHFDYFLLKHLFLRCLLVISHFVLLWWENVLGGYPSFSICGLFLWDLLHGQFL